ncbi:MAG: zinc-binding dehydrogenase [Candidatus Marinimicrobia bacterium]|nr:zinc-binding dehydrogenase [Candidatus Neomarinimicrobiota bacterium]MCF7830305.1 zinc-binding dehydrogenase [Candidatus Neomarinimicrobiota bacterium]MCF7882461.1 zinc-binding dehydrogenase [Candidatus Neomarinimicrobiota bacterium]
MSQMPALIKPRPENGKSWGKGLRLVEKPVPEITRPNQVKIRVQKAAMCGTDVGIYHSRESVRHEMESNRKPEVITGHEFCGVVADAGSLAREFLARSFHERYVYHHSDAVVQEFINGRDYPEIAADPDFIDFLQEHFYITAEMHLVCGVCHACRTGNSHACPNTVIKGVHEDGIFTEYAVIPMENTFIIRKGEIPPEVIAYMDAFGNAVHTAQSVDLMGTSVAVLGIGVQGLMAAAIARWSGASYIIATDFANPDHGYTHEKLQEKRFKVAKNIGVNECVDMALPDAKERLVDTVMHHTNNMGVDVAFEMSGSAAAYRDAFNILRNGGTLSLLGLPDDPVSLDFSDQVIFPGITIKGIIGRGMFDTWEIMYRLLKTGMADLMLENGFVSHTFPLEDYIKAFEVHDQGDAIKVILEP